MPAKLKKLLARKARVKGYSEKELNRYVYGTMRKLGWKPRKEKHRLAQP